MTAFVLILPLFIVMAVAYLLKKVGVLPESISPALNKLLINLLLPALLFRSTSRTEISEVGVAAAGFLSAVLLVTALAILLGLSMPRRSRGAFVQSSFRGNLAYLGLPVVTAAVGAEAAPIAAAILASGLILHVILTILLLQTLDPDRQSMQLPDSIKTIIKNPLIVSSVAGILFSLTGLTLPPILAQLLDLLARAALPLALVVIGTTISFTGVRDRISVTLLAVGLKLLVMPAVAYLVTRFLYGGAGEILVIVVLMAASPTAILAQTFAEAFNADSRLAAATVGLSTLLGILTFSFWSVLLGI